MRVLRGRTNFVLILLSSFWLSLGRGVVTPIVPLYMNSLSLSALEVGAGFSAWGFGTLVSEPLVGLLADKGRRKELTSVMLVMVALFYAAFPRTTSLLGVAALQFLLGTMFAGLAVLFRYTVPDTAPGMPTTKVYGILGAVYFSAAVAGSVIGGLVGSSLGYAATFYAGSILSIAALVTLLSNRFPASPPSQSKAKEDGTGPRGDLVWLVLLGVVAAVAFVALTLFLSLIPLVIAGPPYSSSVLEVSLLVATFNLSVLIFYPLMGSVGSSRPVRWILAGLLVGTLAFFIPVLSQTTAVFFVSAFLGGISFSMLAPLSLALFVELAPKSKKGFAIGVYGAAEDVGIIVGPAVFGAALVGLGVSAAFIIIVAINLASFAFLVARRPPAS